MHARWLHLTCLALLLGASAARAEEGPAPAPAVGTDSEAAVEQAGADEAAASAQACEACVTPEGWHGDLWLDAWLMSGGTPTWLRQAPTAGSGLGLDADLTRVAADESRWTLRARDLGLDAPALNLERRQPGAWRAALDLRTLPWSVVPGARTPFRGIRSSDLTLPAGFVRGDSTSNLSTLATDLRRMDVGFERERLGVDWRWTPDERWSLHASARHETKRGTDVTGASVLNRAVLLPEALDQSTDAFDLGLAWVTPVWRWSFDHTLSRFEERHASLAWDLPFTSLDPSLTRSALAAPPDNEARRWLMRAGWRGVSWLRVDAELGRGELTQDQAFVAATTHPTLVVALPRNSLDGQVDTSLEALRFTLLPLPALTVRADVRREERDDRTPSALWQQVIGDSLLGALVSDPRYDIRRERERLEVDYRVIPGARLQLRGEHRRVERSGQQVTLTEEDRLGLTLRIPTSDSMDAALSIEAADRTAGSAGVPVANGNPLATPLHLAARERTRSRAEFGIHPTAGFDIEFRVERVEDTYPDTAIGVVSGSQLGTGLDLGWQAGERTYFAAWFARHSERDEQLGSSNFATADWRATSSDLSRTLGTEWRHTTASGATRLTGELGWADAVGAVTTSVSGVTHFPDLNQRTVWLAFSAEHDLAPERTLRFTLRHERLSGADWALDGVGLTTMPAVLTLGETTPRYEIFLVRIGYRIAF
jgi:MtrB/PioB family decaheme-associated outer membrane protein